MSRRKIQYYRVGAEGIGGFISCSFMMVHALHARVMMELSSIERLLSLLYMYMYAVWPSGRPQFY